MLLFYGHRLTDKASDFKSKDWGFKSLSGLVFSVSPFIKLTCEIMFLVESAMVLWPHRLTDKASEFKSKHWGL